MLILEKGKLFDYQGFSLKCRGYSGVYAVMYLIMTPKISKILGYEVLLSLYHREILLLQGDLPY